MLNELLKALKQAKTDGKTKEIQRIEKQLNKLGMDNNTISTLLKEIN